LAIVPYYSRLFVDPRGEGSNRAKNRVLIRTDLNPTDHTHEKKLVASDVRSKESSEPPQLHVDCAYSSS